MDISDPFLYNMLEVQFFVQLDEGNLKTAKSLAEYDEQEIPEFLNKYIKLPEGYENDKTAKRLFNKIENSSNSFFLTGKAGTGKSTFIHYFRKTTNKNVLVFAFTGIAAINVGGQTIHSFFRFPLKPLLPNDEEITRFSQSHPQRKILQATDTIIIDEVSMLRADVLEGLDYSLRVNGGNPNKLFGGKQLILVGDIFQLPPVVDSQDEVEFELFQTIYNSEYFFDSGAYKKLMPENFEFTKVHRQRDKEFVKLLNKVRDCSIDEKGIEKLNSSYEPNHIPAPKDFSISLTTINDMAKKENSSKLKELPHKSHFFSAMILGEFKEEKYPTDPVLELKRNSQVMIVRNDNAQKKRRWVNGTIAKIEFLGEDKMEVRLKDGSVHELKKEVWENRKYEWDKKKGVITSKAIGLFIQFPVKLAWAITIHKSQGLTFEKVIIDLGRGTFVNGQLYTALSRCQSLDGITLNRKIHEDDVIADQRIMDFYNENLNAGSK